VLKSEGHPRSFPERVKNGPMGPIPLLFLVVTFDRGGAERVLTQCSIGLPREKYAVRVAALQCRSGAIAADLARAGVLTHDLDMRGKWDLRVCIRLARLLRRERIRILFAFMFHATLLSRVIGLLCRVPIRITSEHSMDAEGPGRRVLNRWTAPLATHVVAVSERVAAYASRQFRIPPDRLTTIVNGVDCAHFRPAEKSQHLRPSVIGCTARLHTDYDHATLLRAFERLGGRWPEVQLLLVGRGKEESRLRELAETLGVAGRVLFVGEQADVAPWLAQTTVYVQPSRAAGIPISILEAMATGLPVVATAVGGTSEVVVDGETGLLVPPGDPVVLAEALDTLLGNPAMSAAFGLAGRARVEVHFSETRMLERVEALLDTLVVRHLGLTFDPSKGWMKY
jgi:glycosyltransferase involved in cell wall biosynthesis